MGNIVSGKNSKEFLLGSIESLSFFFHPSGLLSPRKVFWKPGFFGRHLVKQSLHIFPVLWIKGQPGQFIMPMKVLNCLYIYWNDKPGSFKNLTLCKNCFSKNGKNFWCTRLERNNWQNNKWICYFKKITTFLWAERVMTFTFLK